LRRLTISRIRPSKTPCVRPCALLPRNTHRRGSISKPGWFRKGNVSGVGMARKGFGGEWDKALVSCRHQLPARFPLQHLFLVEIELFQTRRKKDFIKQRIMWKMCYYYFEFSGNKVHSSLMWQRV